MPENSKYHFPEFIARELSNDAPLSENDMRLIDDIYLKAENFSYPTSQTELNWQKVKTRINSPESQPALKIVRNNSLYTITKWAAAAIVVFAVSFGIFRYTSHQAANRLTLVESTGDSQKKITLADGSIITLNTFSDLSANDFKSDERIVSLDGEAYFEVVHNNKPFIVKTKGGTVNVLGTKFNVKNRKDLPLQIALSSGKVTFNTASGNFIMEPGDVITQRQDNTFVRSNINYATLKWLEEQKLVFENETLSNIISALESQYNVTLEYDPKLKTEKLTLTFNKLTATQAAELLSKTLNSKVIVK